MIIKYSNNKIEKTLTNPALLKKEYGKLSESIKVVLSILQFADNLDEVPNVPPTKRHKLSGKYLGCWGISISKNWRVIIKPDFQTNDLKDIKEIIIIEIVDYH